MMHIAFLLTFAVFVNAVLVAIAANTAARFTVPLQFTTPLPFAALVTSTLVQVFVGSQDATPLAAFGIILAIGAVTVCGITDAQTGFVFDAITIPSAFTVLIFYAADKAFVPALLGAAAAAGALGLLYVLTWGRGIGLGDVKLGFCVGAPLGAADAMTSVALAFVLGGIYASYVLLTRRSRRGDAVHFGPYLACAMLLIAVHRVVA